MTPRLSQYHRNDSAQLHFSFTFEFIKGRGSCLWSHWRTSEVASLCVNPSWCRWARAELIERGGGGRSNTRLSRFPHPSGVKWARSVGSENAYFLCLFPLYLGTLGDDGEILTARRRVACKDGVNYGNVYKHGSCHDPW